MSYSYVVPVKVAKGTVLVKEVASILEEFNSLDKVKAVLLDNTNTNTGCESLVTFLEKKINLNVNTIFRHLDGCTKIPASFNGPIGKFGERDYHEQRKSNYQIKRVFR